MQEVIHANPSKAAAAGLLEAANLPVADLTAAHLEHFFYYGAPQAPIGLVGLELCGPDALLRSLVLTPSHRGSGLGAQLVRHAEDHARSHGARCVYLLTTTAAEFFARHAYAVADRAAAPPAIRATREFSDICPASYAFLVKALRIPLSPEDRP